MNRWWTKNVIPSICLWYSAGFSFKTRVNRPLYRAQTICSGSRKNSFEKGQDQPKRQSLYLKCTAINFQFDDGFACTIPENLRMYRISSAFLYFHPVWQRMAFFVNLKTRLPYYSVWMKVFELFIDHRLLAEHSFATNRCQNDIYSNGMKRG